MENKYTLGDLDLYFRQHLVSATIEPNWFNDLLVTLRRDEFEVTRLIHMDSQDVMEELDNMVKILDSNYPYPIELD